MKRSIFRVVVMFCFIWLFFPAVSAKADPLTVKSYEEWMQREPQSTDEYGYEFSVSGTYYNGLKFQWPEEEVTITIRKSLYVDGDWEIPANVTVNNQAQVRLNGGKLIVKGKWNNTGTTGGAAVFQGYESDGIVVEDGGVFTVDSSNSSAFDDMLVKTGGTLAINNYGIRIAPEKTLELEENASIVKKEQYADIRLDGTLKGHGTELDIPISIRDGYSNNSGNGVISGDLTLNRIWVSDGTLTIPEGSKIVCDSLQLGEYEGTEVSDAIIAGELTCKPIEEYGGSVFIRGKSTLELTETGILNLEPKTRLNELTDTAKIIGNGRINAYAIIEDGKIRYAPNVNYTTMLDEKRFQEIIEKGYLADTITIWKSWVCDHQWTKGEVVAPTCTKEGYTNYTCSLCNVVKKDDIKEKLAHIPEQHNDCTKDIKCTICGQVLTPAPGHKWKYETEENKVKKICEVCGAEDILQANEWVIMNGKWRYLHVDGTYTTNNWEEIDERWYYFDAEGYMMTGWIWVDGKSYYLHEDGHMASNETIDGYYVDASGAWVENEWVLTNSKWWYKHADGTYTTNGWEEIDGRWYYFDAEGYMKTGWIWVEGVCYYLYEDGHMASNETIDGCYVNSSGAWVQDKWVLTNNKWWYKHADGTYTTNGWEEIDGKWYYFDAEGYMKTGWIWVEGVCYYLYSDGHMASNETIDGYYVNASGAWVA